MLNIEKRKLTVYSFNNVDYTSLVELKKAAISEIVGQVDDTTESTISAIVDNGDDIIKILKMKDKKQRTGKPAKVQSSGGKRGRPKGSRNAPKDEPDEPARVRTADEVKSEKGPF